MVCRFLANTFGSWGDVHISIFTYLFVPYVRDCSLREQGEQMDDWLWWIESEFGVDDLLTRMRCR